MSKKKTYLIAAAVTGFLILCLLLLAFVGRNRRSDLTNLNPPIDTTGYAPNSDIACLQYNYKQTYGDENILRSCVMTETNARITTALLLDYAEFAAFEARINENEFPPELVFDSLGTELDEAFFAENNLLVIDFFVSLCRGLYPRLVLTEEVDFFSPARFTLQYQEDPTSAGDTCGVLYLVPLPKDTVGATVHVVRVENWAALSE